MTPDNFRSGFGMFKLYPCLKSLGCGSQGLNDGAAWYWRESRAWRAATQEEFDELAKKELTHKFKPVEDESYGKRWRREQRELAQRNAEALANFPKPEPWKRCEHWQPGSP